MTSSCLFVARIMTCSFALGAFFTIPSTSYSKNRCVCEAEGRAHASGASSIVYVFFFTYDNIFNIESIQVCSDSILVCIDSVHVCIESVHASIVPILILYWSF